MAIESYVIVTLASVELGNDYDAELTVTDPLTMIEATTSLTPDQADALAEELRATAAVARASRAEDAARRAASEPSHCFDIDYPVAREVRSRAQSVHASVDQAQTDSMWRGIEL